MKRVSGLLIFLALCAVPPVRAQNRLHHYDGSTEATSRAGAAAPATSLQRIPADQASGATAVGQIVVVIQDQNTSTPEMYGCEIRRNDPAAPPTGSPDVTAAGLIGSAGPFSITLPGGPISAVVVTVALTPPVFLPGPPSATVPKGDVYTCVRLDTPWVLTGTPGVITDGISVHISGTVFGSPGEQMNPAATGYAGIAGQAGLGWDLAAGAPSALVSGSNRAWVILTRLVDATAQAFANNPTVFTGAAAAPNSAGANPNFGYAGIWPAMNRSVGGLYPDSGSVLIPDGVGVRVDATAPIGSPVLFLLGLALLPMPLPGSTFGISGSLFVLPSAVLGPFATGPATPTPVSGLAVLPPATTSEAVLGPFPGGPQYAGGIAYIQALVLSAPPAVTTMCTVYL